MRALASTAILLAACTVGEFNVTTTTSTSAPDEEESTSTGPTLESTGLGATSSVDTASDSTSSSSGLGDSSEGSESGSGTGSSTGPVPGCSADPLGLVCTCDGEQVPAMAYPDACRCGGDIMSPSACWCVGGSCSCQVMDGDCICDFGPAPWGYCEPVCGYVGGDCLCNGEPAEATVCSGCYDPTTAACLCPLEATPFGCFCGDVEFPPDACD